MKWRIYKSVVDGYWVLQGPRTFIKCVTWQAARYLFNRWAYPA